MNAPNIPVLADLAGWKVLFVMAAEAEYGPRLRERIEPLVTGVGPIEASVTLSAGLERLRAADRLPDVVVSLGSAGSRTLEQAAVYQVGTVSWRDMDASPLGFAKGVTPFADHAVEMPLWAPVTRIPTVRLSTGADIVSGAGYDAIDADMVDMETFAVLRSCQHFRLPLIGFRGVSDGASELHHYDDWTILLHVVDEELAKAVDDLEVSLAESAAPSSGDSRIQKVSSLPSFV